VGWSLFLIIHAGLQWDLRNHPLLALFRHRFSGIWIYGGALLGLLQLVLIAGKAEALL
jgi:hypothetical protein